MDQRHQVRGIDVGVVRDEYKRRGLDQLSDASLVAAVAAIVAQPRHIKANSFVLHAPLELAARATLLPQVHPDARELARLHVVALAAQYEAADGPADLPEAPPRAGQDRAEGSPGSEALSTEALAEAIAGGELVEVDRIAQLLTSDHNAVASTMALTDVVAPLTAAAAHAPIFLYHLHRQHPRSGVSANLLRPLARELARQPDWKVRWLSDVDWQQKRTTSTDPAALGAALRATPLLGMPESTFIHPLLMRVDDGRASSLLEPLLGDWNPGAARAVLRTAAWSMLLDNRDEAPYGWSHCLTIPQAILGIAQWSTNPANLLALAATHVVAFRASLGEAELEDRPAVDDLPLVDPTHLASQAASSHDAHIVKYVLACLDAAADDADATALYLNAAQHLLNVWADNGGDPTDPIAS